MDKVLHAHYLRYVIVGLAAASAILAGCSSGSGKNGGAPPAVTTTSAATRSIAPTTTATVASTTAAVTRAATSATTTIPTRSPTATPTVKPTSSSGAEIKVSMSNNTFPEEIRVKAGSKVVFVVTNESSNDKHSFEFPDFGLTHDVQAGETVRIEWQVPSRKGTWDAGCFLTQPGGIHDGMEGHLIIE